MNGKIHSSVGFTSVDGPIRKLTLRDRLQQVVNLGQPQDINGQLVDKAKAKVMLMRYKQELLDAVV